jgi:hypothetical protein
LYPVITAPPLLDGMVHDKLICVGDTAVAERFVGALGVFRVEVDFGCANASGDGSSLVPNEVIAYTR